MGYINHDNNVANGAINALANQKPHTDNSTGLELKHILADLNPVPADTLESHQTLAPLATIDGLDRSVLMLSNNISIITGEGKGDIAQVANSIGLVLSDNQGSPATLASYSIDKPQQKPYIIDTSLPSAFILGDMSIDSEWWCIDSLDDGIKLYKALNAIEPVTIFISINPYQFNDVIKHFAEVKQVNINVTCDKADKLSQQLAGVNAILWSSVLSLAHCMEYDQLPRDILQADDTKQIDLAILAWGEPEPLANSPSKPTPYPIDAWSGLLRRVIEKIAYYAQVPHAMAGQCVLGALAHIGQRYVNAPLGFGYQPSSLILITEGESGSGKSYAMKLSHYEINNAETQQYQIYNEQLTSWQNDRASLTGKELKEFLATEPPPVNKESIFKDGTIEPILDKYINGEVINASWSTDEAGQFFNSHTMKGDTAGSAMSAITKLYDDGSINRLRSQKGVNANPRTQAHDVRFTMFLMGQRVILEPALTNPILNGQGILARGLIACPASLQGKREWSDPERRKKSPYNDQYLISYWERCRSLLDPVATRNPEYKMATGGRPKRLNMPWQNTEAEQAFYEAMQRIENKQAKGGIYEQLKAYASRMGQNASRIATLLALFDERTAITTDDIHRAFLMVEYYMGERLRYLDASPTGEQNDSEKLSCWLVDKARGKNPPVLNKSFVLQNAPRVLRGKKLHDLLEGLESMGHIKLEAEERKKLVYINPKLYG